jgi:hypothetical protein
MNAIDVFPRRPLKISPVGSSLWPGFVPVLAFFGFLAAIGFEIFYYNPQLIDDYRLANAAAPSPRASISPGGRCTRHNYILTDCDFTVRYSVDNKPMTQTMHYIALVQTVDDTSPLTVGYDPADPTHITTSWGRDLLVSRIATQVVALLLLALLLFGGVYEMRRRLRARAAAAAISQDAKPIAARFLKAHPTRHVTDISFAWTDPADGMEKRGNTRMARGMRPFWLDAGKQTMLALAAPGGKAQLLDDKLRTVALTDAERQAVLRTAIPA